MSQSHNCEMSMKRRILAAVVFPLIALGSAQVRTDAGFGWATDQQLKDAAVAVPSAWGKGIPLWQDYVAGTKPEVADDVFCVTDFSVAPDGTVDISYSPDLGDKRSYTILGCGNLERVGTERVGTDPVKRAFYGAFRDLNLLNDLGSG